MSALSWGGAIAALRFTLGGWLLVASLLELFYPPAIRAFARTGYPHWVHLLLAGSEAIAAVLFLIPRSALSGGWGLLALLLIAAGLHWSIGRNPVVLLVYALGVAIVLRYGMTSDLNSHGARSHSHERD